MKNKNELNSQKLKFTCNEDMLDFETTAELEPIQAGIGQDRGIKALEFGLQVDVKGYNIYIEGPSGVGKTMYTKNYLNKISTKKRFQMIGAIYIILIHQMNQLQFHCRRDRVKNLKMQWMDL